MSWLHFLMSVVIIQLFEALKIQSSVLARVCHGIYCAVINSKRSNKGQQLRKQKAKARNALADDIA